MPATTRSVLRIVRPENEREESGVPLGRRIRHALVCLDRTPASEVCLPYAQIAAEAFGAQLTLTHVIPSVSPGSRTDLLEWEVARRESDRYLATASELLQARVPTAVSSIVTQGSPGDRLALTVCELDADLAVVAVSPTIDRRSGARGAIVQRLLGFTSASVLVAQAPSPVPPKHITVLLDGSARAESVLPSVVALAQRYGSDVTLAHVVAERQLSRVLASPSDVLIAQQLTTRLQQRAEEYLQRTAQGVLRDVPNVRRVVRARPDDRRALLEIATEAEADLLVFSAHGVTCDPDDACGGVASYLLSHARVPLLVLQDLVDVRDRGESTRAVRRPSGIRLKEDA